jgi:uncharacterized membrane protein YkvA (DUF1232 family)
MTHLDLLPGNGGSVIDTQTPYYQDMLNNIRTTSAQAYAAIYAFVRRIKRELAVWRRIIKHSKTPRASKWILWFALVYAAFSFDVISDFIPILGLLDDLILLAVPIALAIQFVPNGMIAECRVPVAYTPPLIENNPR